MSNTIPPQGPTGPGAPSSNSGEFSPPSAGGAEIQQSSDVYGPVPQPSKAKKSSVVGPAIAAAVITSLIAGGGAGYLAASAVRSGQGAGSAPLNSLEQPAIKSAQEAPDLSLIHI